MTITQIATAGDGYNASIRVYGLGSDNKIYEWKEDQAGWVLFKVEPGEVPF